MRKLFLQLIKFGIVGVIAFLIDYAVLFLCTEYLQIYYLISSIISFTCSVIINYILSMKYVFKGKEDLNKIKEFLIFIILSIIGLLINTISMWVLVSYLLWYYMVAKIIATAIVMMWNFISRKVILEEKNDSKC